MVFIPFKKLTSKATFPDLREKSRLNVSANPPAIYLLYIKLKKRLKNFSCEIGFTCSVGSNTRSNPRCIKFSNYIYLLNPDKAWFTPSSVMC